MIAVTLAGESGEITEYVDIGPVRHERRRSWAGLRPLVDACRRGGLAAVGLPYGPIPPDTARPGVWMLSDLPQPAAAAFGILDRLLADVPVSSGLVMIGGAFSFAGLDGHGGWHSGPGAALLPIAFGPEADACEAPDGLRLVPTSDCPPDLRPLLADAPPFFGYNRLQPAAGALVLATFADGTPALVTSGPSPRRSVAFASDLLPHWGPDAVAWAGLPAFLRALCELAVGSSPAG